MGNSSYYYLNLCSSNMSMDTPTHELLNVVAPCHPALVIDWWAIAEGFWRCIIMHINIFVIVKCFVPHASA